tara:strand:+ start:132 stop:377 length:246 start_codon:yes stop_codon:yes gene_type:complete
MQAVNMGGTLNEYLFDKNRKIPDAHRETICLCRKAGSCRYIGLSPIGYVCVKKTPMKKSLDKLALEGKMRATGDNCEGLGD